MKIKLPVNQHSINRIYPEPWALQTPSSSSWEAAKKEQKKNNENSQDTLFSLKVWSKP